MHLTDWPEVGEPSKDAAGLTAAMDRVREVCSTGSALRKAEGLRVRLPLTRLTVVADDAAALAPYVDLVRDELNVRAVDLTSAGDEAAASFGVRQVLQVNARAAGPRLGRDVQLAIKGAKSGDWSVDEAGVVTSGGFALVEGEYTLVTQVSDTGADDHRAVSMLPGGGFVVLDTEVTPELAAEGLARDVVRAVQQARRDAGLDVSDRIALVLGGDASSVRARQHRDLVAREVLAAPRGRRRGDRRTVGRRRRRSGWRSPRLMPVAVTPASAGAAPVYPDMAEQPDPPAEGAQGRLPRQGSPRGQRRGRGGHDLPGRRTASSAVRTA